MSNQIIKLLGAENRKVKGTFTYWFTVLGSLFIPFVIFLVYFFKSELFIPQEGVNPWGKLINMNLKTISMLLFPIHVILTISLNVGIEHKNESWKKLFVMPLNRSAIYFSKLLFLLYQVLISLVIFSISVLLFGYLLGLIHPELNLVNSSPKLLFLIEICTRLFISILGLFSIQYILSIIFRNAVVSIATGIFLVILATILVQGWQGSVYFPYAFPTYTFINSFELPFTAHDSFFSVSEMYSFIYFALFNVVGLILFKRKKV